MPARCSKRSTSILQNHGAPSWANYPYPDYIVADPDKNPPPAKDYRPWCTDPAVWREAIHNRVANVGKFSDLDTPEGQQKLKQFLNNGYIANYATSFEGWDHNLVLAQKNSELSQAGNDAAGQPVLYRVFDSGGGYAMTVVGYNDDVWIDYNGDGKVQPEEKGAFKIVNSWGTDWPRKQDGGFCWIAYDTLRKHSIFPKVEDPKRIPAFWFNEAWYMLPKPDSNPRMLAQFTLSNAHRNEVDVRLGVSTTALKAPVKVWRPAAITITDLDKEALHEGDGNDQEAKMTSAMGGAYGFDGGDSEVAGTFVFDLDDLASGFTDALPGNQYRFYLMVTDLKKGNETTISDFQVTDGSGKMIAQATGLPMKIDNDTVTIPIDCPAPAAQ